MPGSTVAGNGWTTARRGSFKRGSKGNTVTVEDLAGLIKNPAIEYRPDLPYRVLGETDTFHLPVMDAAA
jgi:hypothetical protein